MANYNGRSIRPALAHRRRSEILRLPLRQRQRGWRATTSRLLSVPNTPLIHQSILSERREAHKSRLWILDACCPVVARTLLERAISESRITTIRLVMACQARSRTMIQEILLATRTALCEVSMVLPLPPDTLEAHQPRKAKNMLSSGSLTKRILEYRLDCRCV